jgi:hypothetical protein
MHKTISSLVFVLALCLFTGAKPGGGGNGWKKADTNLSRWTFSTLPAPQPGDIATCPIQSTYANYTAFVVTNKSGNILGKTMTAVFTVSVTSGDPFYVWGGYNAPGNWGTIAEAGLYFSTDTGFPRNGAPPQSDSDNYWYTPFDRVEVNDLLGTVTLSVQVLPENWSDAYGGWGANNVAGFTAACQGGGVYGIALASNNFFDTGVATTNGTAVLHLHSFTVQ